MPFKAATWAVAAAAVVVVAEGPSVGEWEEAA